MIPFTNDSQELSPTERFEADRALADAMNVAESSLLIIIKLQTQFDKVGIIFRLIISTISGLFFSIFE